MQWLLAPVKAGMIRYESLKSTRFDLADIALLNDMLMVSADNEDIVREHFSKPNS